MSHTIESKFYCIQPIQINVETLSDLFGVKVNHKLIQNQSINDIDKHPKWKLIMDDLYNLYSSIIVLDYQHKFDFTTFKSELNRKEFYVNDKIDISKYLNEKHTDVFLLFDYRLFQFTIVYEVGFSIPLKMVSELTHTDSLGLDFYNSVRNIFVKETNDSLVIPYVFDIKNIVLEFVGSFITKNFLKNFKIESLLIPNNSGNITNVTIIDGIEYDEYKKFSKSFIDLNSFSERVPNNNLPIELDGKNDGNGIDYSKELYYFNGRFHTILLHNTKNEYRYIPIQFQMQYLWFYLSKQINLVLEKYNDNILNDDSISKVTEYSDKIDLIINKVEILNIFNQKFKLSIESDSQIYYMIENRWNIEDMIKGSNEYIKFFKDYLSRLYTKKTSKIEQRQNKILLFITLFQFIALLSVWNDYLSLLDDGLKEKVDEILPLFGSYNNLEFFNLYLPIGFLGIILLMIFYIFRNKE